MVSLKMVKQTSTHVGVYRGQIYVSNILCAFSWNRKKKLTASKHGVESFEKKLCKTLNMHKIFFFSAHNRKIKII